MEPNEIPTKKNKKKVVVLILFILIAINVIALVTTIIYLRFYRSDSETVRVPNNVIADKTAGPSPSSTASSTVKPGTTGSTNSPSKQPTSTPEGSTAVVTAAPTPTPTPTPRQTASPVVTATAEPQYADLLSLYKTESSETTPFETGEMYPGDTVTKYYCLRFAFKNKVTLNYKANIRSGSVGLSEALKIKVSLPDKGIIMYDGVMKDMPASLEYAFTSVNVRKCFMK